MVQKAREGKLAAFFRRQEVLEEECLVVESR